MLLTGVRLYKETSTAHLVCTRLCVLLQKGLLYMYITTVLPDFELTSYTYSETSLQENKRNVRSSIDN